VLGFGWWGFADGRDFGVCSRGCGLGGITFLFRFCVASLSVTLWEYGGGEDREVFGGGGFGWWLGELEIGDRDWGGWRRAGHVRTCVRVPHGERILNLRKSALDERSIERML